jgi:aminoglycoside phosphotransferase
VSTNREKIEGANREALASSQEGLRYSELARYIKEKHPEIKENTIHGARLCLPQRILKQTQAKVPRGF